MRTSSDALAGRRIAVVVVGDVGRSPRMQYHAQALAEHGAEVDLIGYGERPLHESLQRNPRIRLRALPPSRQIARDGAPLLIVGQAAVRAMTLTAQLGTVLRSLPRPDLLLVQTPPAVPLLAVAGIASWWRAIPLVIDWHNLGYTQFALRVGARHPAVGLARWLERRSAPRAAHLCVSQAMRGMLQALGIADATVLYDRPAERFQPGARDRRGAVLAGLPQPINADADSSAAVIVSATSWSPDEDFAVLLEALVRCDEMISVAAHRFPRLHVVITGDGPGRAAFEARLSHTPLRHVSVQTAWLPPQTYAELLGVADLGVCLHRSSSGVDLPMKIADMLGAGLPVCAFDYGPCLREILTPGVNGLLFTSASELAVRLYELFDTSNDGATVKGATPTLPHLRNAAGAAFPRRWQEEWNATALPLLARLLEAGSTRCG